ncbi:MAG: EamA family transporter [Actinobacteria bacterium]|nr:EamA family transporter [Actinomycetota bacterium]
MRTRVSAAWLIPTLAYVVTLGALGVTSKLALRTLGWQELVIWSAGAYLLVAVLLLTVGGGGIHLETNSWWAAISALIVVSSLILLYVALGHGEASKIIPITAAYPAVTMIGAALFLSESITVAKVAGMLLVLAGVVVLTVAD